MYEESGAQKFHTFNENFMNENRKGREIKHLNNCI